MDHQLSIDIDRFEEEVLATVPRYLSIPGAEVTTRAKHQQTNRVTTFAIGFPEQFETWREVKSIADRRGVIYSLLDIQFENKLNIWQLLERFNDDRYAEKALQIAENAKLQNNELSDNYWSALARTNFILTNYKDAEQNCLAAIEIGGRSIRIKRIYADILHCTGRQERAHELYGEILEDRLPKDEEIELSLPELLGFYGDVVNSPIYALDWLTSDEDTNEETWAWANEEFYYSPHFRSQYAFHLIESNEPMKGFAKLLALSKEMPWFKDGVVNAHNLIDQLNLTDKMRDEKLRLKQIIDGNSWQ